MQSTQTQTVHVHCDVRIVQLCNRRQQLVNASHTLLKYVPVTVFISNWEAKHLDAIRKRRAQLGEGAVIKALERIVASEEAERGLDVTIPVGTWKSLNTKPSFWQQHQHRRSKPVRAVRREE